MREVRTGAAPMIAVSRTEIFLGVRASGRSLEDIARPPTAQDTSTPHGGQPQPAT